MRKLGNLPRASLSLISPVLTSLGKPADPAGGSLVSRLVLTVGALVMSLGFSENVRYN